MSRVRALVVVAFGASLLFRGCASGPGPAEDRRVLVEPGMTGEEVRAKIGPPGRILRLDPAPNIEQQTVEVWTYAYAPGPSAGEVALSIAGSALVVVAIAAGGNCGVTGGGPRGPLYRFAVGFGRDGRVRGVTELEKLR